MHLTFAGKIPLARFTLVSLAVAVTSTIAAQPVDSESLPPGLYRGPIMPSYGCHSQIGVSGDCHCSRCRAEEVCCHTIEQVTEEESCWKVRCEKLGIPAIRWPWEPGGSKLTLFSWLPSRHRPCSECGACCSCCASANCTCCTPRCGPVRCVNVLEQESYDVTKCKHKWEIRRLPPCGCRVDTACTCASQSSILEIDSTDDGTLPAPVP